MPRIAPEDSQQIAHITFLCDNIHDFATQIYENLMDREHEEVKRKAEDLVKELGGLIQSLSDEV
jgi:hypothetical protein